MSETQTWDERSSWNFSIHSRVKNKLKTTGFLLGFFFFWEGLQGEQHSGVAGGRQAAALLAQICCSEEVGGGWSNHWISTKGKRKLFSSICVQRFLRLRYKLTHVLPLTPLSGCKSCLIFTHNPVQRTEETAGTPLADSRSDREGVFSKGLFPKPSLGIIREVRKLSDFLQQRAGSERRLAGAVSTQRTWLRTHTHKRAAIYSLKLAWFTHTESRSWNEFNKYNEWRRYSDYVPVSNTDLYPYARTHRFMGANNHRCARTHTHKHSHIHISINRQLIYKWADLCVGLALR